MGSFNDKVKKNRYVFLMAILLVFIAIIGCVNWNVETSEYAESKMWAFLPEDADKSADLFIVAPTVYYGDENSFNMPVDDEKNRSRIIGALNMQLGIYEGLNVFSPYYRQVSISAVTINKYETAFETAYKDVSASYEYYMKNKNNGRPFVLSGFSQGAEMCVRLMKDYPQYSDSIIACYIYGYDVLPEDVNAFLPLVPAKGEKDTGVIVCINSEAETVNDTFTVPGGKKSICINPLNWKTDSTAADKSLNKGACFLDYEGNITNETAGFTGAYIDETRGTLKLPDVDPEAYKSKLTFLKTGEYHMYEYEFFYRNLQENVALRVQSYLDSHK